MDTHSRVKGRKRRACKAPTKCRGGRRASACQERNFTYCAFSSRVVSSRSLVRPLWLEYYVLSGN